MTAITGPADRTDGAGRSRTRVVITGIGLVTPAGCDVETFAATVWRGESLAAPITRFDTAALATRFACEVRGFDPLLHLRPKALRRLDPTAAYAVAAARSALEDGKFTAHHAAPDRCGTVTGVGAGGFASLSGQALAFAGGRPDRLSPLGVVMSIPSSAAGAVNQEIGWHGPGLTVATACASGTTAVGEGARMVRDGTCDAVLAGGTDYGVHPLPLAMFGQMGALSRRNEDPEHACRPFDADRDGYVMGEGAVYLLLESAESALARGAHCYAEVLGYAQNNDAHHISAPLPDGSRAATCIRRALDDAGLAPAQIGHVNAHATGTRANDDMEARALAAVFGERGVPVTASKSVFGHLMGGAGAAEAVVTAIAADRGTVPPMANHEVGDTVPVDAVTGRPRTTGPAPGVSTSFGLGGHNAALVIGPAPTTSRSEFPRQETARP